ncbi:MAG: membrane integrity-associated transporter subunit PqiC [Polyangiaceae bacterium]|nr:membrane integrity-associated transporter subunit PqiC [Polyangiaceae bacterium]
MKAIALVVASGLVGCALTSNAPPVALLFFSPEPPASASETHRPAEAGLALRLGRLESGAHLRNRILVRRTPVEVAAYEDRRWTEYPEAYVRRAVAHALFEERALVPVVAGAAPTLDLELVAFEEVRRGDGSSARIELRYALCGERQVLASGVVVAERRAAAEPFEAIVVAMGAALAAAAAELAEVVVARLAATE